jgi:hypothetical protein
MILLRENRSVCVLSGSEKVSARRIGNKRSQKTVERPGTQTGNGRSHVRIKAESDIVGLNSKSGPIALKPESPNYRSAKPLLPLDYYSVHGFVSSNHVNSAADRIHFGGQGWIIAPDGEVLGAYFARAALYHYGARFERGGAGEAYLPAICVVARKRVWHNNACRTWNHR